MAAKLLLPGLGGKYQSEVFGTSSTTGADTIDMSRCSSFAVQIFHFGGTGGGTVQITHSLDGSTFANLGSTIDCTTSGTTSRFDSSDGPFGILRIDGTSVTDSVYCLIVGYESPGVA
jgi:hypothetical protein